MDIMNASREYIESHVVLFATGAESWNGNNDILAQNYNNYILSVHLCVGEKGDKGHYPGYIEVTLDMLAVWEMKKDELFQLAAENSKKLFPGEISPLSKYTETHSETELMDGIMAPEVFVISNKAHFYGASALFYQPELLSDMSKELGGMDIVLMPLGTDEIYCFGYSDSFKLSEYQELYEDILLSMDQDKECLGTDILCFDAQKSVVENIHGETVIEVSQQEAKGHIQHRGR